MLDGPLIIDLLFWRMNCGLSEKPRADVRPAQYALPLREFQTTGMIRRVAWLKHVEGTARVVTDSPF